LENQSIEAHVFLDEFHGNCEVYARRHKIRIRKSGDCIETFWYGARHVFVMRCEKKLEPFRLRNTEDEYPRLVDQRNCSDVAASQRQSFRARPSYTAIAGRKPSKSDVIHHPTLAFEGIDALDKELERIEKMRSRKAEKQRVMRREQRTLRFEEKLQGALE
jgi:hypothetical protein